MKRHFVWILVGLMLIGNGKIYAIGGSAGGVALSIVEEYDSGIEDLSIDVKGKLVTSWGKIRSSY